MTGKDIILGLLMEKSRTGYELNEVFEKVFTHFYKTSYGMIYPTLKKLTKEGFVEKEVVIQESKPNKNVYTITETGEQEFYKYLQTQISPEARESEFLVRMYLGEYVSKKKLLEWVEEELLRKREIIEKLHADYKVWEPVMTFSQGISYEIGITQFESELNILEQKKNELIDLIEKDKVDD